MSDKDLDRRPASGPTPTPTEFQHRGWPPTRATSLAVSAFTSNTKLILNRVRNGERIELTQRGSPVAVLVSPKDYAGLTAPVPPSSSLGAATARVQVHEQQELMGSTEKSLPAVANQLESSSARDATGATTDAERIDRLPAIIAFLARKYRWSEATPVLTRAALDLEWAELSRFQQDALHARAER